MGSQAAGEELPYIGSKISLITTSDIRYEGVLDSIDPIASTVSLRYVQSFGTEGRPVPIPVPPSPEIYNSVVFYGKHIKDLTVCSEPEAPAPPVGAYPQDPAIMSMEMGGPSGPPQRPGGTSSLLRPGVGSPASHVAGGPSGGPSGAPPPVFAGLGGAPNDMPESCCPPGASFPGRGSTGGAASQQQTGEDLSGVAPGPQQDGARQPTTNPRGRGGRNSGAGGRQAPRGRGQRIDGRDTERTGRADGRGYNGGGPRGVVGELQSRPNMQLRNEVAEEFDFDAMNSKFEKPATMGEGTEFLTTTTAYDKNVSFFDSISCEALEKRSGASGQEQQQQQQQQQEQQQQGNEGKDQEDGRGRRPGTRQQNRALDIDTFGEGAAHFTVRYFGGRRGGRGKGRGNFNRGPGASQQGNRGGGEVKQRR
ncbi:hypothetical protein, conserved [Eimeria praecox]|uniref:FFD box profile domain-containing protein n=1 Tax=Eimeria praecox TaxID=51316 RepID=U6GY45_9EIME|nr:hypothetical protein, conserved [Eimeria praecox]